MTSLVGSIKDINDKFRDDIKQALGDTLFEPTREETTDYHNRFIGKIVNNQDSDNLGRCQVRVYGLFGPEIPDADLPWALPDMEFIGSVKGSFIVPPVGAIVSIYFDKGDIYQPHYTTKVVDSKNMPSRRMKNYPNNMVFFETDSGDYLEMDRTNGVTNFQHRSGTKVTIYNNGDIEFDLNGKGYSVKNAKTSDVGGSESTSLGGNFFVLYSLTGAPPTDSQGNPIQGVGVSKKVTVG